MKIKSIDGKEFLTKFELVQIEITGLCNMNCEHCRASIENKSHMPFWLFKKAVDFGMKEGSKNLKITLSGGEPFLHPNLLNIIKYLKEKEIKDVIITTNGSILRNDLLKKLAKVKIPNFLIQVSIDSTNPTTHDNFRKFKGAFNRANRFLRILKKYKIDYSIKSTITPQTLDEIEDLVKFAIKKKAKRIGIGSVIPSGRGVRNKKLLLTKHQKKLFLKRIIGLKIKYGDKIDIVTEDPLKFLFKDCPWKYGEFDIKDPYFFGGCMAGINICNINTDGTVTPCSMLNIKITNLASKSINKAINEFKNSNVIRKLITRKFNGKCKNCELNRLCGGCRAIAYNLSGNLMGEDVTCWK